MASETFQAWHVPTSSLWMDPAFTSRLDVQRRIRSQSCGMRNKPKQFNRERTLSSKYREMLRGNASELNRFFDQTNDQMMRMTRSETTHIITTRKEKSKEKPITLGDVCSLASHVADKICQKKHHLDSIRGFRYPSTPIGHENQPKKVSPIRSPIRLIDILPKNDD